MPVVPRLEHVDTVLTSWRAGRLGDALRKAEQLAELHKIPFYYHDFREGWQQGIDMSKDMGLYRQSYCGCIYSEQERYDKQFRKKNA